MSTYGQIKLEGGDGGLWLRLKDGDTVKMRIASKPVVYIDNYGNTRFGNVVYNYDAGKAQAFGYGKSVLKALQALEEDEDWGDPSGYDVKISRTGSTKEDTEYHVNPSPNRKDLSDAQLEDVKSVDLEKAFAGAVPASDFAKGTKPTVKEVDVELDKEEEDQISLSDIPF